MLFARQRCLCAEDVVQEAFVRLAAQDLAPENVAGWLSRTVRNGAISAARSDQRRQRHEGIAATRRPAWFVTSDDSPLDGEAATAALEHLPVELRETVVAHLWGGLSFAQIGELSGVSSSTAHRRYLEALAALRERLRVPCPKRS